MKLNKKNIIIMVLLLLLIIIVVVGFIIINNNKKNNLQENENTSGTTNLASETGEYEYSIQSDESNPIEKDGIEAKSINLTSIGDQLEVKTVVQNNTSELLDGFYIEIDLLSDKGNTLTTITDNSTEKVEAGKSIEVTNYVSGFEFADKIKGAKIVSLEKSSMGAALDETFDDMVPDDVEE